MTRMFDEITVRLKRQAKLTGGVFTSLGQEATAVGTAFALEAQDFIAPLIRDIGAVFVKGILPRTIFAQYLGKANAPSRATDVQFHFADLEKGFVGPISHLGDMIPVMAGVLLASTNEKGKSRRRRISRRRRVFDRNFSRRRKFRRRSETSADYDYRKQRLCLFDTDTKSNCRRAFC